MASAAVGSNRLGEHCALALVNPGRRWPRPEGGCFRLLDYQVPIKARQADAPRIGKIDLLGITDRGRPYMTMPSGVFIMQDDQPVQPLHDSAKTPKKPAAFKRKRRKGARKKQDEYVGYAIAVTGWDSYYWFWVSDPKSRYDTGPYSEIATVTFTGGLIRPEGSKYENASLTLSAKEGMMEGRWDEPPTSIGSLTAHEDTLEAYVFIPVERMAALVALAHSGRVQIASIGGTRLRYRSGQVHSISLDTRPEDNDEDED